MGSSREVPAAAKRARLTSGAERMVKERWGSIEVFEKHFNSQPGPLYLFRQAGEDEAERSEVALLRGDTKIVLDSLKHDTTDALAVIVKEVSSANEGDRDAAQNGRALQPDNYQFAPPDETVVAPLEYLGTEVVRHMPLYRDAPDTIKVRWYCATDGHNYWVNPGLLHCPGCGEAIEAPECPSCGAKLPPQLAVPKEITFTFNARRYRTLTGYQQRQIADAVWPLRDGRDTWTLCPMAPGAGMIWHLQTRDEHRASSTATLEHARALLAESGVVTILEDPYAIRTVRERVTEHQKREDH